MGCWLGRRIGVFLIRSHALGAYLFSGPRRLRVTKCLQTTLSPRLMYPEHLNRDLRGFQVSPISPAMITFMAYAMHLSMRLPQYCTTGRSSFLQSLRTRLAETYNGKRTSVCSKLPRLPAEDLLDLSPCLQRTSYLVLLVPSDDTGVPKIFCTSKLQIHSPEGPGSRFYWLWTVRQGELLFDCFAHAIVSIYNIISLAADRRCVLYLGHAFGLSHTLYVGDCNRTKLSVDGSAVFRRHVLEEGPARGDVIGVVQGLFHVNRDPAMA